MNKLRSGNHERGHSILTKSCFDPGNVLSGLPDFLPNDDLSHAKQGLSSAGSWIVLFYPPGAAPHFQQASTGIDAGKHDVGLVCGAFNGASNTGTYCSSTLQFHCCISFGFAICCNHVLHAPSVICLPVWDTKAQKTFRSRPSEMVYAIQDFTDPSVQFLQKCIYSPILVWIGCI